MTSPSAAVGKYVSVAGTRPGHGALGARTGMRESAVGPDDANQKVEQQLALIAGKRSKHAHLIFLHDRLQPRLQLFAAWRKTQYPRSPVRAVHTTIDQAHDFKLVHELANARSVDAHAHRDSVLVEAGLAPEVGQDGELSRLQSLRSNRPGACGGANLKEVARQRERDTRQRKRVPRVGADPCPGLRWNSVSRHCRDSQ